MSMTNMGTYSTVNGVQEYTAANALTVNGGATDESILIYSTGTIGVSPASAIAIDLLRCNLFIKDPVPATQWYNISEASLSYNTDNNNRYSTTSQINLEDCQVVFNASSIKAIFLSDCKNTRIFNAGSTMLTYTQAGANLNDMHLENSNWEVNGQPSEAANIKLVNSAITNYLVPRLDFSYIDLTTGGTNLTLNIGNSGNVSVYMWNFVQFDSTKINHQHVNNRYYDGVSTSWKFKDRDNGTDVNDVLVINSSDKSGSMTELGRFTSNSSGLLVGTYDSRLETTGSSQVRDALFLYENYSDQSGSDYTNGGLSYSITTVTNQIEIRSYLHDAPVGHIVSDTYTGGEQGTIASDFTADTYQNFILNNDLNITQSNKTTVLAYTDLGGNGDKAYDRQKAYWRDNDAKALIGKSGSQLVPGNIDLIFNKTAASVYAATATTQTYKMTTDYTGGMLAEGTGDLTTQNGVILNGGVFNGNINYESSAGTTITDITCDGTIDFDTAGTYYLSGCTLNIVTNSSGGAVTLVKTNGTTITTNTGPNITITNPVAIEVNGVATGNEPTDYVRCHVEAAAGGPETVGTVILNKEAQTVDGSTYKATDTYNYTSDQPVLIGARFKGFDAFEGTGTITSTGLTITAIWVVDPNYN